MGDLSDGLDHSAQTTLTNPGQLTGQRGSWAGRHARALQPGATRRMRGSRWWLALTGREPRIRRA